MLDWFRRDKSSTKEETKVGTACTPGAPGDSAAPQGPTQHDDGAGTAVARLGGAMDYLATPAVAAYFDAREHEAYYHALKHVGPRRDFHERIIAVGTRFI